MKKKKIKYIPENKVSYIKETLTPVYTTEDRLNKVETTIKDLSEVTKNLSETTRDLVETTRNLAETTKKMEREMEETKKEQTEMKKEQIEIKKELKDAMNRLDNAIDMMYLTTCRFQTIAGKKLEDKIGAMLERANLTGKFLNKKIEKVLITLDRSVEVITLCNKNKIILIP